MDVEPAHSEHAEGSKSPCQSPQSASTSPAKSPVRGGDRVDDAPAPPAKRARTDTRAEDRKRGQRMFGNILGTLRKFQDDDKSKRTSEAARRREETSARIAAKIASETNAQHELVGTERELRTLRIATENAAYMLEHREIALTSRHAALRTASRYLHTTSKDSVTDSPADLAAAADGLLFATAPLPVARAPSRRPRADDIAPLFFLPKVLLPEQESALRAQQSRADAVVAEEEESLRAERERTSKAAVVNRERMAELEVKLARIKEAGRRGSEGGSGAGGRERERERERERDREDREREREERERERERSTSARERDLPPHQRENEVDSRLRVKQDDGEMEVEY